MFTGEGGSEGGRKAGRRRMGEKEAQHRKQKDNIRMFRY